MNLNTSGKNSPYRKYAEFLGFGLLLLLPTILMIAPLWRGAIPYFMDPLMYFFPLRVHAAHLLHSGELPLWNRCLMGGMPLFENPQAALAYPLHWPFLVWPNGFWFLWPMLLQLGLYAALTFWALRKIGAGTAAWLGGALALAGSYGWSRLQYGNYLNVLPWWPLWLGAAHAFVVCGKKRWIVAGTLAAALSILGGAHQPAAYGLALLAVYAIVQIAIDRSTRRNWILFIAITFPLALLISAPGWLPQYGFIKQTSRPGGLDVNAVLEGSIHSPFELLKALVGDWSLLRGGVADAEMADAIGPIAFLLAFFIPQRGHRRRAWIACWAAAIIAILLSLSFVMAPLLKVLPVAGIFHGPRRWLGAAQWFLILASALGASSLKFQPRISIGIIASAVLIPAWFTWLTVDRAMIPARFLLDPQDKPLITRAGLQPGERFFVIDYKRDASYDYGRRELLNWALPNLSMLWGYEDLGGYEPAQTAAYREFMNALHEPETWRQPWTNHFGLIRNPTARKFLDAGNVRAAIMPRWGVPMYFRPLADKASVAQGGWPKATIRALIVGWPGTVTSFFTNKAFVQDSTAHPLSNADDQVATTSTPRQSPPGEGSVVVTAYVRGADPAEVLEIQHPPAAKLVEGYAWGASEAALWKPVEIAEIASLMKYAGTPAYAEWKNGSGRLMKQEIKANRVALDLETSGGELIVHDAWWPGWNATVDGKPVEIKREGLWRAIQVPANAHRVEMAYRPPYLAASVILSAMGALLLLMAAKLKFKAR